MREIKFRAWDKTTKTMLHDVSTGTIQIFDASNSAYSENCDLMQFTGLKDRNGTEIYEGDVVLLQEWRGDYLPTEPFDYAKAKVIWDDESAAFFYEKFTEPGTPWMMNSSIESVETIGNIYENPELLK